MVRDIVQIIVHREFFENLYEPNRRKLQKQLKLPNLSHKAFTKYWARSIKKPRFRYTLPKIRGLKL